MAGGASKPPGFIERFEKVLAEAKLPMTIRDVRLAEDPLTSVASGALIAAESEEAKMESAGQLPGQAEEEEPAAEKEEPPAKPK